MPKVLLDKLLAARTFAAGFNTVEFASSALVDMAYHEKTDAPEEPLAFEAETLKRLAAPEVIPMRHRTPQFGHIFSGDGYSAGYYVYIWADTMSADASEAFTEAGSFYDKPTCQRLREKIFSVGNSVPPDVAFRNFRGRDVDTNALMRDRGFPVT